MLDWIAKLSFGNLPEFSRLFCFCWFENSSFAFAGLKMVVAFAGLKVVVAFAGLKMVVAFAEIAAQ